MAKMTERQKRFCDEYLIDLNATQAAIRAGYSVKTADRIGPELLGKTCVSKYLSDAMKNREERTKISQDKVLAELAAVAFSNVTDIATIKEGVVFIKDTEELTEMQTSAIASIKEGRNGVEVKMNDKIKALELLGKHLGLWNEKIELSGSLSANPFSEISTEELRAIINRDG